MKEVLDWSRVGSAVALVLLIVLFLVLAFGPAYARHVAGQEARAEAERIEIISKRLTGETGERYLRYLQAQALREAERVFMVFPAEEGAQNALGTVEIQ